MGLVAATGRRSVKTRLLLGGILLILTAGALTMATPFLLMLTGSTRSGVDQHGFSLLPRFLWDDDALYRKYIEGLYNESPSNLRAAWGVDSADFSRVELLESTDSDVVERWESFLTDYGPPPHERQIGFSYCPVSRGRPLNLRGFLHAVSDAHGGDIHRANQALGTSFPDWNAFLVLPPDTRSRQGVVPDTAWWEAWRRYVREGAPVWTLGAHDLSGYFHETVTVPLSGRGPAREPLSPTPPADSERAEVWEVFVRGAAHPAYARIAASALPAWREFLRARYGELETFNRVAGVQAGAWEEVGLPDPDGEAEVLLNDRRDWLQGWLDAEGRRHEAPLAALSLRSADLAWRSETGAPPPRRQADQRMFERHKSEIRNTFLFQNFGTVWEILILHGRGLWVTVVYCVGSVGIALLVNPMAAYALSRFRPRHTYALLLYLLLTMAFPPMVTQIPLFLMLRDLNMLNTFRALLLPGMAHGYSIFLLKGFFDSLPRELYESASMDGAGEMRMFFTITLSLSKPILAVVALSAFVNAYTAFMFALLICQDERMWTLMVWLYQLQQNYGPGVMNAAFVLAAVPTLLVFLLAQRQILRGIVVPTEK